MEIFVTFYLTLVSYSSPHLSNGFDYNSYSLSMYQDYSEYNETFAKDCVSFELSVALWNTSSKSLPLL